MSFTFRDYAPLAACMMVSKRVRALTKPHYEIDFIADYELQQSKWSRTAFTRDVRVELKKTASICAFPITVCIYQRKLYGCCTWHANTMCTTYERGGYLRRRDCLPRYMAVKNDKTIDPDYHRSDSEDSSDESSSDAE